MILSMLGGRLGLASFVAGLLLVAGGPAVAQDASQAASTPAAETPFTIVSFGGLLGQFDGFCENAATEFYEATKLTLRPCPPAAGGKPGNAARWPAALGGLVGVEDAIAGKWPGALLILQADNQMPDFGDLQEPANVQRMQRQERTSDKPAYGSYIDRYWQRVAALKPRAVALGAEDFHRSLRLSRAVRTERDRQPSKTAARRFVAWVRNHLSAPTPVPFLASNVVVRTQRRDLNQIEVDAMPYRLTLDDDVSVDWLAEIKVEHPCGDDRFELRQGDTVLGLTKKPGSSRDAVECRDSEQQTTTYTIEGGVLSPATSYDVHAIGKGRFASFRTSTPLTPHTRSAASAQDVANSLEGWPVVVDWLGKSPSDSASPLVVVSLASQTFRMSLGESSWKWERPKSGGASSDGDACAPSDTAAAAPKKTTCEIAFLEPTAALTAILGRLQFLRERATKPGDAAQTAPTLPPPFVVLVAALLDDEILTLTEAFPEIRLVVLPPESTLLGRTRQASADGAISGDLGTTGVLDGDRVETTRLLVRPEWVGETIATVALGAPRAGTGWTLAAKAASIQLVPGHPLAWHEAASDPAAGITYGPYGGSDPGSPTYTPYLPCKAGDKGPRCQAFRALWTDQATLVAVMGDALRAIGHADLALLPATLVDPDMIAWLGKSVPGASTAWLTRFLLQRTAYRSYRFVRADVSGADLLGKLQEALKDPLESGSYCISGLGERTACPSVLKNARVEDLRPKGRTVSPTSFYTVMLPDMLAQHLDLNHDKEDGWDAIEALDAHLAARGRILGTRGGRSRARPRSRTPGGRWSSASRRGAPASRGATSRSTTPRSAGPTMTSTHRMGRSKCPAISTWTSLTRSRSRPSSPKRRSTREPST